MDGVTILNRISTPPLQKSQVVIDLVRFNRELTGLLTTSGRLPFDPAFRPQLLERFRAALSEGQDHLHRQHLAGASGQQVVQGRSSLMDALLRRLSMLAGIHHRTQGRQPREGYALVATGGYGRGDLAPYSDIDLLFLLPDGPHPEYGTLVEQILYLLWDLGLEVGHAVRTIDECLEQARKEVEIRTSLLESRFLFGDRRLFKRLQLTLFQKVLPNDRESFLRAKLLEQAKRHDRFGNSLFYLEPNLKESPGGQRDIHTFFWISKYRYRVAQVRELIATGIITAEEYRTFTRCREFYWRCRNALHYRAGRREDRLTFHHQLELAAEFGYRDRPGVRGVEQFMRRYYQVAKQVANLSWIFLQKYQEEHRQGRSGAPIALEDSFVLMGDKVTVARTAAFREDPSRLIKLFEVAQRHGKSIHPEAMRLVSQHLSLVNWPFRKDPVVNQTFLKMLQGRVAVAWVLRKMNICGLLGRFLPEFGRIIGQTQHDLFHVFTVDEHSILAVEALRHIRSGRFIEELPLSSKLIHQVRRPVVLYLATLFHDIAKGRKGQHEIKGAQLTRQIALRLGLSAQDSELTVWLVENHLIFSRTAFRRDINDPQTVAQFAKQVGNKLQLDYLLLLTVADIRAVGPTVWNQWKASSLRRLYQLTEEALDRGLFRPEDIARLVASQKEAVFGLLAGRHPEEAIRHYLDRFYPDYFLGNDPETLAEHFPVVQPLLDQALGIAFLQRPTSDTTSLLIYTPDHFGLMARISGALASAGANILAANISTTKDGMALDNFALQSGQGGPITNEAQLRRIREALELVLTGKATPEQLLARADPRITRKQEHFEVPTEVTADNQYSEVSTLIEITAKDRLGLLFAITRQLERHDVQIRSARIATYGERAVDVFYVRDLFGLKLSEKKLEVINADIRVAIVRLEQAQTTATG